MRYTIDCRDYPSDVNCTLAMTGEHDELIEAQVHHLVAVHGHADTPDLLATLEGVLRPELADRS